MSAFGGKAATAATLGDTEKTARLKALRLAKQASQKKNSDFSL
jgi:hypothetical protein